MSLEEKIAALTVAIEANTAAVKAGGGTPAAAGKPAGKGTGAAAATTTKPKHTREELVAALGQVKEKSDAATARELFKAHAEKMAGIPEGKIDEVFAAATAKIAELDGAAGGGEEESL